VLRHIFHERYNVPEESWPVGDAFQDRHKQGCLCEAPMDGFTAFLTTAWMQELERSRMPEPKSIPHRSRLRVRQTKPFMNNVAQHLGLVFN
jgi:hypothetical protein